MTEIKKGGYIIGAMEGWVKLHRQIMENEIIWDTDEAFDRRSAWLYLVMMANHEDKEVRIRKTNKTVVIKKGQHLVSIRNLADTFHWSKDRVSRFIKLLEKSKMITVTATQGATLLTLVNYGFFQCGCDTDKDTNKDSDKDSDKDTNKDTDKDRTRTKELKNDKNEKNNYIYCAVIDYLNEKAGTQYRANTVSTKKHINARVSEGYTLDDFKKVIDCKVADWKANSKMSKYLAPDTLFGTKFEKYLNQDMSNQYSQCFMEGFSPDIDPKWFGLGGATE